MIDELKSQGIGIIYISHRLDEIFEIADRVTFLRDGEHIDTRPIEGLTREQMIELMVGRSLDKEFPKRDTTPDQPRLVVENPQQRRARAGCVARDSDWRGAEGWN